MKNFKSFIAENTVDLLDAHIACHEGGIPLPDHVKSVKLHSFSDSDIYGDSRYRYEKPDGGFVVHSPFEGRTDSMITHHNAEGKIHRDDGPAQYLPGRNTVSYYKNGVETGGRYPIDSTKPNAQNRYWKHSDDPRHEGLGKEISKEEHDRLFPFKPSHTKT